MHTYKYHITVNQRARKHIPAGWAEVMDGVVRGGDMVWEDVRGRFRTPDSLWEIGKPIETDGQFYCVIRKISQSI